MAEENEYTNEDGTIKDAKAVLDALQRAKKEAKAFREERDSLQQRLDSDDRGADVEKFKQKALRSEAKLALQAQGIKNSDGVAKYLDLEGVDFDDDGGVKGLDDSIKKLKTDIPDLFDPKKRAGQSIADIHEKAGAAKKLTGTEAQVARLFAKQ